MLTSCLVTFTHFLPPTPQEQNKSGISLRWADSLDQSLMGFAGGLLTMMLTINSNCLQRGKTNHHRRPSVSDSSSWIWSSKDTTVYSRMTNQHERHDAYEASHVQYSRDANMMSARLFSLVSESWHSEVYFHITYITFIFLLAGS